MQGNSIIKRFNPKPQDMKSPQSVKGVEMRKFSIQSPSVIHEVLGHKLYLSAMLYGMETEQAQNFLLEQAKLCEVILFLFQTRIQGKSDVTRKAPTIKTLTMINGQGWYQSVNIGGIFKSSASKHELLDEMLQDMASRVSLNIQNEPHWRP